nr:UDP-N-acetylmuramoylalanyl-D-glutamyl-2,6-diaminopimelate--D-alanyl-D-alanine ligase [Pseudovibrio brasiliensis]
MIELPEIDRGPLWLLSDFLEAVDGDVHGDLADDITGISIDSRTIQPGEAFFAIKGENFDGHAFAGTAVEAGASVAVVSREKLGELPEGGRYVAVDDVLKALERLGVAARARSKARIIAVTGSVGKTGTKEALRLCLSKSGITHAPVASFNNHWGVPLTLARMHADTEFGIFEIGMNHRGEITPLVKMVRPHVAIVTTVEPVHLEAFNSVEDIARAKAEIFTGIEPGGVAILNRDNRQYDLLRYLAAVAGVKNIVSFGMQPGAQSIAKKVAVNPDCSCLNANILGQEISYKIGAPGAHHVINSLGVLTGVMELGANLAFAGLALAEMSAPKGRGAQTVLDVNGGTALLVDESYNANPASMRAAINLVAGLPVEKNGRRIAVLGDMLELGADSDKLHADLARELERAKIDIVYCVGTHMKVLWERLPAQTRGAYSETSDKLEKDLLSEVRPNDIVMVKGSLGTRMGPLVDALKKRFPEPAATGKS